MVVDSGRRGLTLIELAIVLVLASVVLVKATVVIREVSTSASRDSGTMVLEDQARLALDRIAYSVMGADRQALIPDLTLLPVHSTDLTYRISLGIEDGQVVWSDPEMIALDGEGTEIVWVQNPDTVDEQKVVWTHFVRSLLEGETINGDDDNANGLIDEEGLTFVVEGNRVTIRLSLARPGEDGELTSRTVETTVVCRNRRGT